MTKNNLLSEKLNYTGISQTPTHLHLCSYNPEGVHDWQRQRYRRNDSSSSAEQHQLDTDTRTAEHGNRAKNLPTLRVSTFWSHKIF